MSLGCLEMFQKNWMIEHALNNFSVECELNKWNTGWESIPLTDSRENLDCHGLRQDLASWQEARRKPRASQAALWCRWVVGSCGFAAHWLVYWLPPQHMLLPQPGLWQPSVYTSCQHLCHVVWVAVYISAVLINLLRVTPKLLLFFHLAFC